MAFYQILFFRKKAYIRKIHKKYGEDRLAHAKNIVCKRRQIVDATWGFHTGLLLLPITGGVSGGFSVLHLRNTHIARQKLNALEKLYEEMYEKKLPEVKLSKTNFAKKCIIFVVQPFMGSWGAECILGETDGEFDFEKELGDDEKEARTENKSSTEEKKVNDAGAKGKGWFGAKNLKKEKREKPVRTFSAESIMLDSVVAGNL